MAKEIIEGVNPTRMELLQIRKRRALAVKGHQLLSEKRDALVSSFFDLIKKRKEKRKRVEEVLMNAYKSLILAEMVMGEENLRKIADKIKLERNVNISSKNIMGVSIPEFEIEEVDMPEYSVFSTFSEFDETVKKGEEAIKEIIELAEIEGSVQMLGREIEKTKRRVNALEYIFIPRLLATISYIERQLEEREREDFFRRKRIKALLERHED
ncbi:MAG TPA: V-type ATP synthase subunit D [Thermoplasmatales archaeon]|nr:V-type ATP synthase subunit D [Thermoplasmatales archaeon]